MLPLERQTKIVQLLEEKNAITITDLAHHFHVHEATIRRDLTLLEKEGNIKRTHGGVVFEKEVHSEPAFHERESVRLNEKKRIGEYAASFIENGDNIILDSGTTTLHIAEAIKKKKDITVITNDINIAAQLRFSEAIKVIVTGGVLFPNSYMLNGRGTDSTLENLNVQKAFIGTPAFHQVKGLTHFDDYLISAKKAMIQSSKHIIVVADHTKINRISLHSVASIPMIHDLITGKEANYTDLESCIKKGINVHFI
ncbi:DeoR/GlpR family DNA-binding transcription regulator [Gracilibacillus phocaeensis]|uniref:DeoR/GlpR family DNA-binding transcription regulator n=1 Tax=Gracilibacillus phocaeensis TaxID=2042304 RepID=UPI0010312C89|nr:DeoR/GlpR family DNA-binding transcription regulator [Gracilibacillus phocaeensis]